MMIKTIKVAAPATIANLACGFDVLGLALHDPADLLELTVTESPAIVIESITGYNNISSDPDKNVVGVVLEAFRQKLNIKTGFTSKLHKGIALGSGVGSSAASSVAAAVAANILFNNVLNNNQLVEIAMEGEFLASGSRHADNVAPAIFGGITIVRSYNPLDIIRLDSPSDLVCVVLHPGIKMETRHSRAMLKKTLPLSTAVMQWGNTAAFVAGVIKNDYDLISRPLNDVVAEPDRKMLIPAFDALKQTAISAGALGAGISGSGPSVFALCKGADSAKREANEMSSFYKTQNIEFDVYISEVNPFGTRIIEI